MEVDRSELISLALRVVEQAENALTLEWTLLNKSPDTLVVLRHLFRSIDASGRYVIEPNLAYVSVDEAGEVVAGAWILPVPERGIQVLTPFVPLGEELGPGMRMTQTVTLSLPLYEWNPYLEILRAHGAGTTARPAEVRSLRYRLGVYRKEPGAGGTLVETSLGPLVYPSSMEIMKRQILLDTPPVAVMAQAFR